MSKTKIVFLVESISQPRCIKRVIAISQEGYDCVVYGYDRKKSSVNTFPSNIDVSVLGEMIDGGGYVSKFFQMKRDLSEIIKKHKSENVVYYSFGFVFSTLLYFNRCRYIYEMSDILYGYPKFDLVRPVLKCLDRNVIKKAVFTVMTSEGFKKYLAPNNNNIVLQPNKINSTLAGYKREVRYIKPSEGLKFSFVGRMRYETILSFAKVIGEYFPDHSFNFYGDSSGCMLEHCLQLEQKYNNIKYYGAYKNPEDLSSIYNNTDIVVSCYTTDFLNEKLAEPNKLYEALFFCKPIIVSDGIFLADQVRKYGCGYCIDATTFSSIKSFVDSLVVEEINNIVDRESKISEDEIIDSIYNISSRLSGL